MSGRSPRRRRSRRRRGDGGRAGGARARGTFPRTDLVFLDPFDNANWADRDLKGVGDYNGDGYADFVISTVKGYAVFVY